MTSCCSLGMLWPLARLSWTFHACPPCEPWTLSLKFRKLQAFSPNLKKSHVDCRYWRTCVPPKLQEPRPITPASAGTRSEKHFSVDISKARSGPSFIHTPTVCLIRNYFPLRAGIWISWDVAKSFKKELLRGGGVSGRRRQIMVGEKKIRVSDQCGSVMNHNQRVFACLTGFSGVFSIHFGINLTIMCPKSVF